MIDITDKSNEIYEKIEKLKEKILSGEISLLDLELKPIFQDILDSLNISNIDKYSELYKETCLILEQKFEELKIFLNLLDSDKIFIKFLNSKPTEKEISKLLEECWRQVFVIENITINELTKANEIYSKDTIKPIIIEHLEKQVVDNEFLVKIPDQNFTQKMFNYFNEIKNKLPCKFKHIFEDDNDQIEIFEHFMFLLHLLQLGKIKYQKDTKSLYI